MNNKKYREIANPLWKREVERRVLKAEEVLGSKDKEAAQLRLAKLDKEIENLQTELCSLTERLLTNQRKRHSLRLEFQLYNKTFPNHFKLFGNTFYQVLNSQYYISSGFYLFDLQEYMFYGNESFEGLENTPADQMEKYFKSPTRNSKNDDIPKYSVKLNKISAARSALDLYLIAKYEAIPAETKLIDPDLGFSLANLLVRFVGKQEFVTLEQNNPEKTVDNSQTPE